MPVGIKKSNQKYYFINLHGKKLRLQYQEKMEDGTFLNRQIERSLVRYGYKLAKKLLLEEYNKRTGEKVKLPDIKMEGIKKPLDEKKIDAMEILPDNYSYVETINDIHWDELFTKETGSTLMFVAKSKSGKTTAMISIWNNFLKHIWDVGILSSQTLIAPIYKEFKGILKMNGVSDEIMKLVYRIQKHSKRAYNLGFIFDDMNPKDKSRNIELFTSLSSYLRNLKINSCWLSQDMKLALSPIGRGSVNYWLISRVDMMEKDRQDDVVDMLMPYFKSLRDLPIGKQKQLILDWINNKTQNFGYIFLDTINNKIIHCKNKIKKVEDK